MVALVFRLVAIALATILPVLRGAQVVASASDATMANPIRKVVTMLQTMAKKIEAEGEEEEANYKKFVCYCKTNSGDLSAAIEAGEAKAPQVFSDIEEAMGEKGQLAEDLKAHAADRDAAKASVAEANGIREKQAATFSASKADHEANIGAIKKAVASLEKGMAGGFLQTGPAQVLRKLMDAKEVNMIDADRQTVVAFLAGGQSSGYTPQSGEITGILKNIGDEMSKSLEDETATEQSAISDHAALVAAKSKEVAAHTTAIEEKTVRHGEVSVNIVNLKNALTDTQEALLNDKAFLKELESGCGTKEAEWSERSKTRADEQVALAETIKLLNDDDALELFKKAVPTGASFVQMSGTATRMRARALAVLRAARTPEHPRPRLDLIALALQSKTGGFEKVVAMIDDMVNLLKKEQQDDDHKKEYCAKELDLADDKKKGLERSASDAQIAATNADEAIATLSEELKALTTGIADLDKSVAEATEQRKDEHAAFNELFALNTQATELLGVAKNRLNQFYNPRLYVAPPKKELSREDRIASNFGGASFVQVSSHAGHHAAPPPPPETFDAYNKKSEESTGVIAMIDLLVKDVTKETTEAQTSEKDAQADYETMLADAKSKRAADSKSVMGKEAEKASFEEQAQSHKDSNAAAKKELMATAEYIHGLHAECDWLVENYDVRKSARAGEVDSLANAKAVLSGADYSLVQMRRASAPTCPQTKMEYAVSADAGGNDIWQDCHYNGQQNECHNIGVGAVKKLKFCGPGELTISRMTCNNHDYKAETIVHKNTEYTTQCEEIDMASTIAGPVGDAPAYWGSFTLKSC